VLFADIVGSTELARRLDPEAVRAMIARFFEAVREVVHRHDGLIEKFIGDAVLAIFGVPEAHEDDAIRAVSAGLELHEAIKALNRELVRDRRETIHVRPTVPCSSRGRRRTGVP
jgi:class 3 adenylate cyclase